MGLGQNCVIPGGIKTSSLKSHTLSPEFSLAKGPKIYKKKIFI